MRLIDADALLKVISNAEPINLGWITDRITNAPTVQREGWVSVEDRLPEIDRDVLLFNDNIFTGFYARSENFRNTEGNRCYGITYWHDLPAAPKE